MSFGPIQKFKQFLNYPSNALTPSNIFSSMKHTWNYYSQRRQLCKRHFLRPSRIPQLYFLQKILDLRHRRYLETFKLVLLRHHPKESLFADKSKAELLLPDRYLLIKTNFPPTVSSPLRTIQELWLSLYVSEGPYLERFQGTVKNGFSYLKSLQYIDSFAKWLVTYMNLYHEALRQLIEGHREVTQDHSIRLPDGKTVSEKLQEFESSLKEHIPQYQDFAQIRAKFSKDKEKK